MTATAHSASGVVQRAALFDLLDRGVQGPVTLVCAPAGSGKTMLVRSWLESRGPPMAVARLAVASDESDATRFWGAVTDALRRSGAVASDDPLATLAAAPMGGQRAFVSGLIEGLERLSSPVPGSTGRSRCAPRLPPGPAASRRRLSAAATPTRSSCRSRPWPSFATAPSAGCRSCRWCACIGSPSRNSGRSSSSS